MENEKNDKMTFDPKIFIGEDGEFVEVDMLKLAHVAIRYTTDTVKPIDFIDLDKLIDLFTATFRSGALWGYAEAMKSKQAEENDNGK